MTLYTHSAPLPAHQYAWVQPEACGEHGWERVIWFGLTSYPGRAWGCHVMFECGAVYRNVPLHMLATRRDAEPWTAQQAQLWDCYGWQFAVLQYAYLAGQGMTARIDGCDHEGGYVFTAVPVGDAFSAEPEQSKEFMFVALDNGRYTAQPTNRVLVHDRSFVTAPAWPDWLRRQQAIVTVE